MASTSLKELSKAIHAFLGDPTLPLPDKLLDTINSFTERKAEFNNAAVDRFQEDLLSIFEKRVKHEPNATGPWVAILRRLFSVLQTPERVFPWFDSCKGVIDRVDVDKLAVDETVAALRDLVALIDNSHSTTFDADSAAHRIIDRLFEVWMDRFYPALLDGKTSSEYNERLIRHALSSFGKKRPKELFTITDTYFVRKSCRKPVLRFLCDFIQSQPPHLHQILHTSLFGDLLTCLQQDTSTTIVSGALTTLIMLLPHMPSSLVPHLPALFNIYGRLLFWDRDRSGTTEMPEIESGGTEQPTKWDVYAFDPEVDDQTIAHLPNYYTILYGLYPINFMDYIRKPQRYMRHANAANPDDLEVQPTEMRHRSETFRRNHLLHPNFYSLTIDSEKVDFGRWIKSEAAEVVAECMGLSLETDLYNFAELGANSASDPAAVLADIMDGSNADSALLSGSAGKRESWRHAHQANTDSGLSNQTLVTMMRRSSQASLPSNRDSGGDGAKARIVGSDSPTLTLSPSQSQLQDLIQSNKAIKSGLHQSLANDSTASLALSHQESVPEKAAPGPSASGTSQQPPIPSGSPFSVPEMSTQVSHLQKQILLLQNDLSFERYLKQQHMAHIGDLRRKQMSEAATEAETQNLILMNRNLKSRFEDAKKSEMQVKKESEKSRAMAKKWEADLANKLKTLRDDSKKTHTALETLRRELDESKQEGDKLRKLLCAAEVKELNWKQNMQSIEIHGAETDRLKAEVERLTRSVRDYQAEEQARREAVNSAAEAESQLEGLKMKSAAQEQELQRAKTSLQTQVEALQAELSEAQEMRERPGANSDLAVESALAASRAKQAELQKQHSLLMRKYTALQSSLLDMQSEQTAEQQSFRPSPPQQQHQSASESDYNSLSTSPGVVKSRSHRAPSNAEGTGHNTSSSAGSQVGRQTQAAGEGSGSVPASVSPERHFGSGLQGRLRRESRDKGKEEGSGSTGKKKEKKSSGLRGIRGF